MGEDRSRSRNPSLLANLALIRNALLAVLESSDQTQPFHAFIWSVEQGYLQQLLASAS